MKRNKTLKLFTILFYMEVKEVLFYQGNGEENPNKICNLPKKHLNSISTTEFFLYFNGMFKLMRRK